MSLNEDEQDAQCTISGENL